MTDEPKSRVIPRVDLYQQVWQTPVERLAQEYGISGQGLSKICARLNVPVPPRGYWAKLAAGRPTVTYRLPPPSPDTLLTAEITSTPDLPLPDPLPEAVQQILVSMPTRNEQIVVPATLAGAHPVVKRTS